MKQHTNKEAPGTPSGVCELLIDRRSLQRTLLRMVMSQRASRKAWAYCTWVVGPLESRLSYAKGGIAPRLLETEVIPVEVGQNDLLA